MVVAEIEPPGYGNAVAMDLRAPEAPAALVEAALRRMADRHHREQRRSNPRGDFLQLTETD